MRAYHSEGGPATMTANVAKVEQILYVMVKNQLLFELMFLYNCLCRKSDDVSSNSDICVGITKKVSNN